MNKTILILALVTTFMIGTSISFVVSNYEAEAIPEKIDPVADAIDRLTAVIQGTATQGPQGDKGDTGDTGPQGPAGPISVELYKVSSTIAGNLQKFDLSCNAGDTVISGYLILPSPVELNTHAFWPIDNDNGMHFGYSLDSGLFPVTVQIVCSKGSLP